MRGMEKEVDADENRGGGVAQLGTGRLLNT